MAHDPTLPAWGIAVASKFPAVGAVVPWAQAGAGAVATQSYANTSYGPIGLRHMQAGLSAAVTLERLLSDDPDREQRQVGLVDAQGGAATFTGSGCHAWAGGLAEQGFAIQGNILAGPDVIDAMASTYRDAEGDLADRLLAALLAGDRAGGDRRGRQSAALLAVCAGGGYSGFNDRWFDYRVDDHPDPVPRLGELLELHRLYFGESPPEERLEIAGQVLTGLGRLLVSEGLLAKVPDELTPETRSTLRSFLGNENFEERSDVEAGWIDRPAYEFLLRRLSGPEAAPAED